MATVYFSKGDGAVTDSIPMTSPQGVMILPGGLLAPTPPKGAKFRRVRLDLHITGTSPDAMWRNYRALHRKLRQARKYAGPYATSASGVTLGVQLGTTEMVYFDVVDGELDYDELTPQSNWMTATLELECLRYARGTRLTPDNLLSATLDFSDAAWVKSLATIDPDGSTAPYSGTGTADHLVEDSSAGAHYVQQSVTTVAGTIYGAVYVRAASRSYLSIRLLDAASVAFARVEGQLTAGTGSLVSGTGYRIEDVGDGTAWKRVVVWGTNATTTTRLRILLGDGSTYSYTGNGTSFARVWGPQIAYTDPGSVFVDKGSTTQMTQGLSAYTYFAGVPGDADAVVRAYVEDESTGGYFLQKLRVARRSADDLGVVDYDPFINFVATGIGATATDGTGDYTGSNFVRASPTSTPTAMARVTRTSGREYNSGIVSIYGRLRDSNITPGTPTGVTLSAQGRTSTILQSVTASGTGTSVTVELPATPRVGAPLLLAVMIGNRTATITATGYTSQVSQAHGASAAKAQIFQRRTVDGDDGSITVTFSTSVPYHVILMEPLGLAYTGSAGTTGGTAFTAAAAQGQNLLPSDTGRGLVVVAGYRIGGAGNVTYQVGTTHGSAFELYDGGTGWVGYANPSSAAAGGVEASGIAADGVTVGVYYPTPDPGEALGFAPSTQYEVRVAARDTLGNEGAASTAKTITVPATYVAYAIGVVWRNAEGAARYRVYYRQKGTTPWEFWDTGASTGTVESRMLPNLTGTSGTPLDVTSAAMTEVRASIGMAGGGFRYDGPFVQVAHGGNQWEWVYLGTYALPPVLPGEGDSSADSIWTITLEVQNAGDSGTFDADHVMLVAHDEPVVVARPPDGTSVPGLRDWELETRRDGRSVARLWTNAGVDSGRLVMDGDLLAGPGCTTFAYQSEVTGDYASILNAKWRVGYSITPQYEAVTGMVY